MKPVLIVRRVAAVADAVEFNGVAGKMTILPTKHRKTRFVQRMHFDLVR